MAIGTGTALVLGAAASAGTAAYSSRQQSRAARDAAGAQVAANADAIDVQERIFAQQRQDTAPIRQTGNYAYQMMARHLGVPGYDPNDRTFEGGSAPGAVSNQPNYATPSYGRPQQLPGGSGPQVPQNAFGGRIYGGGGAMPSANAPMTPGATPQPGGVGRLQTGGRYDSFFESPGYQFAFDEGMRGVNAAASAGGFLESGRHLRDANIYATGMASQEYGQYFNRLASMTGAGQVATNTAVNAAGNFGNNVSSITADSGAARASGLVAQGNARAGAASAYGNLIGQGIGSYLALAS